MSSFIIEAPKDYQVIKEALPRKLQAFSSQIMQENRLPADAKVNRVLYELERGCYWGVLFAVDGCGSFIQPDTLAAREAKRKLARKTFSDDQLQGILNLCVETALTVPFQTSAPATYKGHSVLYRELVDKKDSMFCEAVTPEFKKLLNNGRLWEEMPDMDTSLNYGVSYRVAEDVLVNNYSDLEVEFVPKGYQLFQRNYGENNCFNLHRLSDQGVDRYAEYFVQVNKRRQALGMSIDQLAHLVRPYVVETIAFTEEDYYKRLRFPKTRPRSYLERLHEPLVSEFMESSDLVRTAVANELQLTAVYGNYQAAIEILASLPESKDLFDRMVRRMVLPQSDLARLVEKAQAGGLDLVPMMGDESLTIWQSYLAEEKPLPTKRFSKR